MIGSGLLEHVFGGELAPGLIAAPDAPQAYAFSEAPEIRIAETAPLAPTPVLKASAVGVVQSGGVGDDRLFGGNDDDTFFGLLGDDTIVGRGGLDNLVGAGGEDVLRGGAGDDTLRGGGDDDTLRGGGGDDILRGGGGDDSILGGAGKDRAFGGAGNDTLKGQGAADFLSGQGKNDELIGNKGDDTLRGGGGRDTLDGGPDDDLLEGGAGDDLLGTSDGFDTLTGGPGADIYVVRLVNGEIDEASVDVVTDFDYVGGDRVGLTEALSGVAFNDIRDVVRATPTDGDTVISVDRGQGFQTALILQGVEFTIDQLATYGFTTPPRNSTAFQENPYGFSNNSQAAVDPAITPDGALVAFVDKRNLDLDPDDPIPSGGGDASEDNATKDVFVLNVASGAFERVSEADLDGDGVFSIMRSTTGGTTEAASPAISDDGRFVAFASTGVGVAEDRNTSGDVYVRDMLLGTAPVLVSVGEDGLAAGGVFVSTDDDTTRSGSVLDISGDGTKIAFVTTAALSPTLDQNSLRDVYLRDLEAGTTTLVSRIDDPLNANDGLAGGNASLVKLSADGRYVAFTTSAALLAEDDVSGPDVYLRDMETGETLLITGGQSGFLRGFDISSDGSRIAFSTDEALERGDLNGLADVYVVDIDLQSFTVGDPVRMSEAEGGVELLNGGSYAPVLSPDGEKVAFLSTSDDLAPFDSAIDFGDARNDDRLYVIDVSTGALEATSEPYTEDRKGDNGSTFGGAHFDLGDDEIVYRIEVPADPDDSGRPVADTFTVEDPIPAPADDDGLTGDFDLNRLNTFIRSSIDEPGDVDVFSFRGPQAASARDMVVIVDAAFSGAGTLTNPKVTIYERSIDPGNVIATNADVGVVHDEYVEFEISGSTGVRYFIEVEGVGGRTGTYRVGVDQPSINPDSTTTLLLREGADQSNQVSSSAPDWFRFGAEEGDSYVFSLTQPNEPFQPDPMQITLLDIDGNVVAESAFSGASSNTGAAEVTNTFIFTPAEDQLLFAVVSTDDPDLETYTLSVAEADGVF